MRQLGILLLITALSAQGQVDFDDYKPLVSFGQLPSDFYGQVYQKVEDEKGQLDGVSRDLEDKILKQTNYGINWLLQSGQVLTGDPLSKYVSEVAHNALISQPDVIKELRFYVIRSSETNAFSTRQGIIFVTVGLLAQLENEAQLAYILCHEAAHYIHNHVVEGIVHHSSVTSGSGHLSDALVRQLSGFSKERELEADLEGLRYFAESDYDLMEALSSLEVLMYSHLPFNQLPWDKSMLEHGSLEIPESLLPDEPNPIEARDEEDDDYSTHPNIATRRSKLDKEISRIDGGGHKLYLLGKDRFIDIRDIARFETIYYYLVRRDYGKAIYSGHIMRSKYPDSRFLARTDAFAWYALAKHKNSGEYFEVRVGSVKKVEGESYPLHYILRKLKKSQLNAVAYRQVQKWRQSTRDPFITRLEQDLFLELVDRSGIDLWDLQSKSLAEAREALEKKDEEQESEEYVDNDDETDADDSKYKLIKSKRGSLEKNSSIEEIPDKLFHQFAFADLMQDDSFKERWELAKDSLAGLDEWQHPFSEHVPLVMSNEGLKKQDPLGVNSVIMAAPIYEFSTTNKQKLVKSEKRKENISGSLQEIGELAGVDVDLLDLSKAEGNNVQMMNELSRLVDWQYEVLFTSEVPGFITFSNSFAREILGNNKSSHVMFSIIDVTKERNFGLFNWVMVLLVYTSPIALVDYLIPRNYTGISSMTMDLDKDEIVFLYSRSIRSSGRPLEVKAYLYEMMNALGSNTPKK